MNRKRALPEEDDPVEDDPDEDDNDETHAPDDRTDNDQSILIRIEVSQATFDRDIEELLVAYRLVSTISTNNMHVLDARRKLLHVKTPADIFQLHFDKRKMLYERRYAHLLQDLERQVRILGEKARFIREVAQGTLVISKRARADVLVDMQGRGYVECASLLQLAIGTLTMERAQEVERESEAAQEALQKLRQRTALDLWVDDLDALQAHWQPHFSLADRVVA